MGSKHDSKDGAGNMISSETSQTEVWIDRGFEEAAMHVCQRFEDNTDRDTGSPRNVSPPPPVQCSSPGFVSSEVKSDSAWENIRQSRAFRSQLQGRGAQ